MSSLSVEDSLREEFLKYLTGKNNGQDFRHPFQINVYTSRFYQKEIKGRGKGKVTETFHDKGWVFIG